MSLTTAQKAKFDILTGSLHAIHPFDRAIFFELLVAGLDRTKFDELDLSYNEAFKTLTEPMQQLSGDASDMEQFKFVHRYRDYFKTLLFKYDDIRDWLLAESRATMQKMGVGDELIESVVTKFDTETLQGCRKEDDESLFDFYRLLF